LLNFPAERPLTTCRKEYDGILHEIIITKSLMKFLYSLLECDDILFTKMFGQKSVNARTLLNALITQ